MLGYANPDQSNILIFFQYFCGIFFMCLHEIWPFIIIFVILFFFFFS